MPTPEETVLAIVGAPDWNARVARIRQIPQQHGTNQHSAIYGAVAAQLYVPNLAPDFAYVHWRSDYEISDFLTRYDKTAEITKGFTLVDADSLVELVRAYPQSLKVLRVLVGFTAQEFAASTQLVAKKLELPAITSGMVKSIENGVATDSGHAQVAGLTINEIMVGGLFEDPPPPLKPKLAKPDTSEGWEGVQRFARDGVPFGMFLHQRHYGGAFRQLLDATSTKRGDIIEDAVEQVFKAHGIPFIRTGSHNQAEIESRFEVAVRPAPDFVVYDQNGGLRAMLECKGANDGGTARDKALRFAKLREESARLNGTPLFAVLGGLGWTRVNDTLGPVVRDCDGRVFTLSNLEEMISTQPFPQLFGHRI